MQGKDWAILMKQEKVRCQIPRAKPEKTFNESKERQVETKKA